MTLNQLPWTMNHLLTTNDPQTKRKTTLDYVQCAASQLYQQDHIPWQKYTHHLKKKQKSKKPTAPSHEHHDWVTDSDSVTHL